MLGTVHGRYKATIVIILCSGICGLRINEKDAVTDKFLNNNLNLETIQLVESIKPNENDVEIIPEDDIGLLFTTVEANRNQNEDLEKETINGEADGILKQRRTRQATHGYSPLYPQLPSGPPYNPYQPNNNPPGQNPYQQQPTYNPYGPNPNQQQPTYNPPGQNPNQQQPTYNPSGQNPYPQRPTQWSTNSYNSSQPGNPTHNYNPNTGFSNPNQGPYNPSSSQTPYNPHPNYPSYNNSSPGNSYRPPNGQYPVHNQTFPPHTGSFRPPSASGPSITTPWPAYNPQPGQNFNNNPYPGQTPFNNNYPPSSGNKHPIQPLNSTSQRTPYFNPSQYPSYNNTRPNPSQWPSTANSQYPNFPGARPSYNYNMSQGNYNSTLPRPPQGSPYNPGSNGQYPSNTNFNPNYPSSNSSTGYSFANTYNPSIPNYPPQNNNYNQAQNNFFYPQKNNTVYDPRRVPPQNFSYH